MGGSAALVSRLTPPISTRLSDEDAERVRRNHEQRISELQALPAAGMRVLKGIQLPPSTDVVISHGLGRAPQFVLVSPVIGALTGGGVLIREFRGVTNAGSPIDAAKSICLRADIATNTITVDVAVF
jgi:hypothetical protein